MSVRVLASTCCPPFLRPAFDRLEASPIALRLARGVFWSLAGAVISRGLMLVASVLVARFLGKTGYGELGMIQSTVGMFGVLAGFGLGMTATKYVAEFRESDPERAGRIIAMAWLVAAVTGGLMAAGLCILAPWLAEHTINAPHLAGVLRIGAVMLLIHALNGAQTGALSGFEAFRTIARVNLFVGLLSFPILIAGAYVGGLRGAVWGLAFNLALNWILNHLAIRQEARRFHIPLTFRQWGRELPILWRFSLPAVLAGSMTGPVTWACSAMLVNQPDGYGEMAVFSAANQWFTLILFLPSMLGSVVLPMLSQQIGQNNSRQTLKILTLSVKVNLLIVVPLVAVACMTSPSIMSLYGNSFRNGWPTMVVVSVTAGLLAAQTPVGQIIAASGRMWMALIMNAAWALAFAVGTLLLIGNGSLGLASARAIAYVLHGTWTFGFAIWLLREQERTR